MIAAFIWGLILGIIGHRMFFQSGLKKGYFAAGYMSGIEIAISHPKLLIDPKLTLKIAKEEVERFLKDKNI